MFKAEADGGGSTERSNRGRRTSEPRATGSDVPWIRKLVDAHFDFIWLSLRRLGVPEGEVDDAAQKVFCVALRRANDLGEGRERSFLFATAMNVAADMRRSRTRARVVADEDAVARAVQPMSNPEELLDRKRAREALDEVLDAMNSDLRAVFVLAELEEMTAPEIAALLEVPLGTVASRLRRAREEFRTQVKRFQARTASSRVDEPVVGVPPGDDR